MLSFSLVVVSLKPLLYRFKKAANLLTRLAVLKLKKDQEIEKGPRNWNAFKKRIKIGKGKINWIGTPKIKRLPKLANLERSNGVHFAVFPIYMPLVNETLDFKITNIKTRFFTKSGLNFVFLCKNMLKFLYETRKKLKLFLIKTVSFIKHGQIAHKRSNSYKK